MDEQQEVKETKVGKVKRFLVECLRVLRVTKKPDKIEFMTIFKVAGLGILAIGLIGFLIQMIKSIMFKGL